VSGARPPALDPFETAFQTARISAIRMLRGRRWIFAAVIVLLPVAVALLATAGTGRPGRDERVFYNVLTFLHFGIVVPGAALAFATSFPWEDADDGSLVWWFTAPVRRWAIHAGRYAAALAFGTILLPGSVLLLTLPLSSAPEAGIPRVAATAVAATLLAYPAYLAIFWLLTTLTRRALVLGLIFVVIENVLALSRGNLARLTVIHYVRSFLLPAIPSTTGERAKIITRFAEEMPVFVPVAVLGGAAVVALGLSLRLVERIEYRGKSSQAN
jgi:hypothetical protein